MLSFTLMTPTQCIKASSVMLTRTCIDGNAGFDVVLMDMAMPVMGGVDATRAIRQLGATVPIIAMTANASDKDRDECRAAGMDGFLSKPVLKDRLAEAITQVLSGNTWSNCK